jgi:hypothetical protein
VDISSRRRAGLAQPGTPGELPPVALEPERHVRLGAAMVIIAIVLGGVLLVYQFLPAGSSSVTTTSTFYQVGPKPIVASAVESNSVGFTSVSSGSGPSGDPTRLSAWASAQQPDGTAANMTVFVYLSYNMSQSYYTRFVNSVQSLPGYTDISSVLGSYQHYGRCYAYGEDVDGIGVADGICAKGNVILRVHLVSGVSFSTIEDYLTGLMGSLYDSVS